MLASPIIESTLPAFYVNDDGIAEIAIPFFMSRAVNQNEVKGFRLKIKNIQGSSYLVTLDHTKVDYAESKVYFSIPKATLSNQFLLGQFYKAQLAYVDLSGTTGYYSSVGVIKYTTKPKVAILNLKESLNNAHAYHYVGTYSQLKQDTTEKEYAYRFIIRDDKDEVVKDTGFIVHNSSNDENHYESQDSFSFTHDFEQNRKYTITYTVKTNNNLEVSSPAYRIMQKKSIAADLKGRLLTSLNYDNGYISVQLEGEKDGSGLEIPVRGSFILSRASETSNYMDWEQIAEFSLASQKPSSKVWKDFAIEQGVRYKYSIQQYNSNLFSDRIISEEAILADFEDCFLYDGKRQLKIRFNPKVTSFKKDVLEAKVDTLGSKYPFIFKNGQVEYKEFPISGLISYLSDEQSLFMDNQKDFSIQEERVEGKTYTPAFFPAREKNKNENDDREENYSEREKVYKKNYLFYYIFSNGQYERWVHYASKTFGLTTTQVGEWRRVYLQFRDYEKKLYIQSRFKANDSTTKFTDEVSNTIFKEREFKLEVLDWLTNGEPKLFKSPAEGNYIVRLMNVSLSPNDALGRMLHTFNATAYEVADINYDSLVSLGIVGQESGSRIFLKVMTIPLCTRDENYAKLSTINYELDEASGVYYASGNLIKTGIIAENAVLNDIEPGTEFLINGSSVIIGGSGTYNIPVEVSQITLLPPQKSTGLLTISYMSEINNTFNQVVGSDIKEVLGQQKVGRFDNVLNTIENIERRVTTFYDIKLKERPVQPAVAQVRYDEMEYGVVLPANYKDYYILKDGNYVTPSAFSFLNTYYKRVLHLSSSAAGNQPIAAFDWFSGTLPANTYINQDLNPLFAYKYTLSEDPLLGGLYVKVTFSETDKQDSITNWDRALKNRTSTNPYLYDYRDFILMVQTGQLYVYSQGKFTLVPATTTSHDPEKIYFIKEQIEYVFTPEESHKVYLTPECYNKFLDLWSWEKKIDDDTSLEIEQTFKTYYHRYLAYAFINGESFDISVSGEYSTGPVGLISGLQTEAGVYCELYYQVQIVNYNISQAYELSELKLQLQDYDNKLTKDYMLQQCIDSHNEDDYIKMLEVIQKNYHKIYSDYIDALTLHLNKLSEEG